MILIRLLVLSSLLISVSCSGSGGGSSSPQPPSYVVAIPWDQEVMIIWDEVPDAVSFNLYWSTSPGINRNDRIKITGVTSPYLHQSLNNGTTYYYVVTSVNGDGVEGEESIEAGAMPSTSPPFVLPDTGQDISHTSIYGEDSDYLIHPPSYTDNGDGTVMDNITGLMWQKGDDGIIRNQDEAIAYCRGLELGGYTDWRLPSVRELSSLIQYDMFSPAISDTAFPDIRPEHYWSSTVNPVDSSKAWYVNFYDGYVFNHYRDYYDYVICVRGYIYPPQRFVDNGDGTVTDRSTGLTWQRVSLDGYTLEEAIHYCEDISLGGYDDWRLPNIRELQSLVDYEKINPSIDTSYFPDTRSSGYWSSTFHALHNSYGWYVDFSSGYTGSADLNNGFSIRCVRGGL